MYYHPNREAAQATINKAKEQFAGQIYTNHISFEPDNGWVAQIFCWQDIPELHETCEVHAAGVGRVSAKVEDKQRYKPAPKAVSQGGGDGGARPNKGATARVWAIADEVTGDGPIDRTKVIEACVAAGINKSTAGTQYSKWKKSREAAQ